MQRRRPHALAAVRNHAIGVAHEHQIPEVAVREEQGVVARHVASPGTKDLIGRGDQVRKLGRQARAWSIHPTIIAGAGPIAIEALPHS